MTKLAIQHPNRKVHLITDSWGNRYFWNPVLGTVDMVPRGRRNVYQSFVLGSSDMDIHGALRFALLRAGVQLLPGKPGFRLAAVS
jgi:hypothetical protein